jgi:hypothetical protein
MGKKMKEDSENNQKQNGKFRRLLAIAFIVLGVLLNKFVLEKIVTADGQITSFSKNALIALAQFILILCGILLLLKKPLLRLYIVRTPTLIVGIIGLFFTLLISPPVFGRIFAMAPLLTNEIGGLWIFFLIMLSISVFFIFYRGRFSNELTLIFFSFLFLLFIELSVRLVVNVSSRRARDMLAGLANRTYPEMTLYSGHPFMQYTFNSGFVTHDDTSGGSLKLFNRYGYKGPDYPYKKPPHTIRIACLGGSTTAHGYPKMMEEYIKTLPEVKNDSLIFECMNFGVSGYSSSHSVVNLALNVIDFQPDYIVLHHGWNDEMVRNVPSDKFKSDYSHGFIYYHEPEIPDRFPIRISVIYRYFKQALTGVPVWAYLIPATVTRDPDRLLADAEKYQWKNLEELEPFRRNYETMIDLALARGIQPVIVTMPRTVNPQLPFYYVHPHVDQCNTIARETYNKYQDKVIFVDLDSLITGKRDDYFLDLGHMEEEGERLKASEIGNAIIKHYYGDGSKSLRTNRNSK